MFTQKVMMRVTRSDGTQEVQYMRDGQKPRQGDEIVIRGTRGSDRCEVYVTSSGTMYKVKDESLIVGGAYQGN
jgi:predicted secreted protein